jgi:outer membrane protein assembly factor BamA
MRAISRVPAAHLLLCALALCALIFSAHAQTYNPKTIRIDAPPTVDTAEALHIAALPTGVPLTKQQIETALQHLADTGLFSEISYTVNATALTIKLTPSASSQLQPVHFANFVWWQPAELETLVEARVPAYHGQLPLAGTLTDQVEAALVSLLKTKGIDDANVEARQSGQSANAVTLSITHPSIIIDQVNLENTLPTLKRQLKSFTDSLHTQDFDLDEATRTIDDSVADIYKSAGYLDVSTTPPTVSAPHKDLLSYAVDLTATIQPGDLYTIRAIAIPPVSSISSSNLEQAAALHVGDPASTSALRLATAELAKACADSGYLNATAKVALSKDTSAHTIAYAFTITPGELYHFASLDTSALTPQQQQSIAHSFHATPGAVFDRQLTSALAAALLQLRLPKMPSYLRKADPTNHTVTLIIEPAPTSPNR